MTQVKAVTESFSVLCSQLGGPYYENIQKDGRKTFSRCFRIFGNKQNILSFRRNIGFGLNEQKLKELENALVILKMRGKGFEPLYPLRD